MEEKIVQLRKRGYTYTAIQLTLGSPSKKFIKQVLKDHCPELLGDVVNNYNRLHKKY